MDTKSVIREIIQDDLKLHCIVKGLFDQYDSRGTEKINTEQLFSLLKFVCHESSWRPPQMTEVRDIMKEFDLDRDGFITYSEFLYLIKRILMSSIDT
jgi:Ca2+-binding EF-hand superfamily protein